MNPDWLASTATYLQVTIRVPDDLAQANSFYYVLLSVWDNAGSYDQIGLANDYGTWGLAYSWTSYCAGTYYYSPDALTLQPGQSYDFVMSVSSGQVVFAAYYTSNATLVWSYSADTGGTDFQIGEFYSCDFGLAEDYTNYEEVYNTPGPVPPYEFFFTYNYVGSSLETSWSKWLVSAPSVVNVFPNDADVAIANEPYYLAFTNGLDSTIVKPTSSMDTFYWNVSVIDLSSDSPIYLAGYSVPGAWILNISNSEGPPPFTSEFSFAIPSTAPDGLYYIGLVAFDGSGSYSQVTLVVQVASTYRVTFSEVGLPPGTGWGVDFTSGPYSSAGTSGASSFEIPFLNGTYGFIVWAVRGYVASPAGGTFTVQGRPADINLTFTSTVTYDVDWYEVGLPAGAAWTICVPGPEGGCATVEAPGGYVLGVFNNGSYSYNISTSDVSYLPSTPSSAFVVDGTNQSIYVGFIEAYAVTFNETGLPSQTSWSVMLNGATGTSTGTSITFSASNGTYVFLITPVAGYTAQPGAGSVTVNGTNVQVRPIFSPMTYTVTFAETGLPSGINWTVTVNGVSMRLTINAASINGLMWTGLPNGTYTYSIAAVSGWHQITIADSGSVAVSGASVTEPTLAYTQVTYSVTFATGGLPSGTTWSVTLNGVTTSNTSSTIAFVEPNGTYSYAISDVQGWHQSTLSVRRNGDNLGIPSQRARVGVHPGDVLGNVRDRWSSVRDNLVSHAQRGYDVQHILYDRFR